MRWGAALSITVAAGCVVLLALPALSRGIWMDEALTLDLIRSNQFLDSLRATDHPPLYFLALRVWTLIVADLPFARFLSVLCVAGAVSAMAALLSDRGRLTVAVGVGLVVTLPMVLRYSVELRGYGLLLFATASAFAAGRRVARRPWRLPGWWILTISLICAVSTHLIGVLLVPPVLIFIMMSFNQGYRIPRGRLVLIGIGTIGLDLVFRFLFLRGVPIHDWWMPKPSLDLLVSNGQYLLGFTSALWGTPGLSLSLPHPTLDLVLRRSSELIWLGILVPLLVMGRWRDGRPFLAAGLVYLIELLAISVLLVPVMWYRTMLPAIIPIFAFVAVMVGTAKRQAVRVVGGIAVTALATLQVTGWIVNRAGMDYEPWSKVGSMVDSQWRPEIKIFIYPDYVLPALEETSAAVRCATTVVPVSLGAESETLGLFEGQDGVILVSRWDMRTRRDPTRDSLPDYFFRRLGAPDVDFELDVLRVRVYSSPAFKGVPMNADGVASVLTVP